MGLSFPFICTYCETAMKYMFISLLLVGKPYEIMKIERQDLPNRVKYGYI
jgi:hypothetical protein